MLTEVPPEEYAAALDEVAAAVLAEAGIDRPPVDPFVVARKLRITVAEDASQAGRGRYVRLGGRRGHRPQPTVLLRPEERPERSNWNLAHEIGEHLAHRVFGRLNVAPSEAPGGARESVANHLGRCLLLPTSWFLPDGKACGWDLLWLKQRYGTASHEVLVRRMLDLPPPVIITIFDKGERGFRRSNIQGCVPPMAEIEVECRRRAHEQGETVCGQASPLRVRAWAIHEPGWKREILRTEVDTW